MLFKTALKFMVVLLVIGLTISISQAAELSGQQQLTPISLKPAQQGGVTWNIQPASQTITPSQIITVEVTINDVVDMGAFDFAIDYDPAVIQVNGVTIGPFPGSTGRNYQPLGPNIDNTGGSVSFGAYSLGSTPDGPSGDGVLAYVQIETLAVGSSNLQFTKNDVSDKTGTPQSTAQVNDGQITVATNPVVSLSHTSLDFGTQAVGSTSPTQTVDLTNSGGTELSITNITVSGDYDMAHNCPTPLNASATCAIDISFTPTADGSRNGTLTISSNASSSPDTVSLSGTGFVAAPIVSLNPTSVSFGNQAVNTTSATETVTMENTGTAPLTVTNITVNGDYDMAHNCPATLDVSATCDIDLSFMPTAAGSRNGTLTISSNASSSPDTVSLSGTGTAPLVSLTPTTLDFGGQRVGTTSAAQTISLQNTGTAPLTINDISASGAYSLTHDCSATLASSATCTLTISFSPTVTGSAAGIVSVSSDATTSPDTASLSGTGTAPAVTLSATLLDFGNQVINATSATQTLSLTNSGRAPLALTDISVSGDYALSHNCPASLAAGVGCTLSLSFSPTQTGSRPGTLTLQHDAAGSPHTIRLAGTGLDPAAPGVQLTPNQLDFGTQEINTTSTVKTVNLENPGNAALTINDILVTGDFSQSHNCPASLGAATTCTISLTFSPTLTGTRVGLLTINSNAPTSPDSVSLSGTGAEPQPPITPSDPNLDFDDTTMTRTLTITNDGSSPITIRDITADAPFNQTNNCPAVLSAGAVCQITVGFNPTGPGTSNGDLTIDTDASTGPTIINLNGESNNPQQPPITPSDPNLDFDDTTMTRTLTITNDGSSPITIRDITADAPFNQTNNCPAVLSAGAVCQVTVGFNPTGPGISNGNLTIDTDAPTGPTVIDLNGQSGGTTSPVTLSTTDLRLTSPHVGGVSPSQVVTLTNTGQSPFAVGNISTSGVFSQSHNCDPTLAAGATCQIAVTFNPTSPSPATGSLAIDANGEIHQVDLTGNVTNPSSCPFPLTGVGVTVLGPQKGVVGAQDSFSAVPNPANATPPHTYVWNPQPTQGQGTAQATYRWGQAGPQAVSVTVSNCGGVSDDTLPVTIAEPPPVSAGDSYEEDDQCNQATAIVVNGTSQDHTFHDSGDEDWVQFPAVAGQTYIVAARVPPQAQTDVVLEMYQQCNTNPSQQQDAFSGDVRQIFVATQDGPLYLRLRNSQAALFGADHQYSLSVENLQQSAPTGAMIIVAGRHEDEDDLQDNIHHVTRKVYQMALDSGCTAENIYVLATDPTLPGFSTFARTDALEQAITEWAVNKIAVNKPLTLFMMDHGADDTFYLDGRDQIVTPAQLDTWLTEVELQTQAPTNVIIEACNSGSFIDPAPSISKPQRVVIASTGSSRLAYASDKGAVFADTLLEQFIGGANLHHAFIEARWTAEQNDINQTPWLDDNGNARPNEPNSEGELAAQRIFACTPPQPKANMQPDVAELLVRRLDPATEQGEIWAKVLDDQQVTSVWAMVYPPSHNQSRQANDSLTPPVLRTMLQPQANDWYGVSYTQFTETGDYRIVLYAEDDTGLQSRARELVVSTVVRATGQIYLPILRK